MKRIDQMQNSVPSFSRLRKPRELATYRPEASSGKLSSSSSSSSTSANRSDGVMEYWSVGLQTSEIWAQSKVASPNSASCIGINNNRTSGSSSLPVRDFRGLSLELFARSVMNSETVLPKAVKTAGLNNAPIEWGLRQRRLAATISLERRVVSKQ